MDAKEFAQFFIKLVEKDMPSFVANMERLGEKDKKLHEWVDTFMSWTELDNVADAEYFYPQYYRIPK